MTRFGQDDAVATHTLTRYVANAEHIIADRDAHTVISERQRCIIIVVGVFHLFDAQAAGRNSVRGCCVPFHGACSHRCWRHDLHVVTGNVDQVWSDDFSVACLQYLMYLMSSDADSAIRVWPKCSTAASLLYWTA